MSWALAAFLVTLLSCELRGIAGERRRAREAMWQLGQLAATAETAHRRRLSHHDA